MNTIFMKTADTDTTLDIAGYYQTLMRRKWLIALAAAVMIALAAHYNARLVPIYQATATLIIDKESTRFPITGQSIDYDTYLSESLTFNTHFELITSRPVLEQVVKELMLDQVDKNKQKEEFIEVNPVRRFFSRIQSNVGLLSDSEKPLPSQNPQSALIQMLKSLIEIENIEDTRLLKIRASSPNPQRAADIANALGQAYIDFNITNRMKAAQDTLAWLTDRLYEIKKNLEDAEKEFLEYKQKVRLISVEDKQKVIGQKIVDFNDAYFQARNKRLELDTKLQQLNQISKSGRDIPLLRSLVENRLISDLHTQLVEAELERNRLSKVYKSKHPKMIQINSRIDQTHEKLGQEVQKEIENLKSERSVLMAREQLLQETITDFEKEGIETNKSELQHTMLKRNVEMNQQLYDALLVRLKEADLTGNVDVSNIRLTEKAEPPSSPMGPNKKRNFLLGLILGLLTGVGLSFLLEYFQRTLRTEEDVRKYLGLPVLAIIPIAEKGRQTIYVDPSDAGHGVQGSETQRLK